MTTRRVTGLYIAFQLFFGLLLWVPIFYEFQKRIGLSDESIFGIQSLYYLSFCVFEVPTGFLGDRFGYRRSMIGGALVLVAANLLPIATPGYTGMLTHFLAVALARSLISGAASAYLYEYLKQRGESAIYKKIEGDARSYGLIAKVFAWAAVGPLMAWSLTSPYWLTAINAALAALAAFYLPETGMVIAQTADGTPRRAGVLGSFWEALSDVLRSPALSVMILLGAGIFVMTRILQVNLFQPILDQKGFAVTHFGWIMAAMTLSEAWGAKNAVKVRARFDDATAVFLSTVAIVVVTGLIALSGMIGTVALLCLFSVGTGLAFPIQRQLMHDYVGTSPYRATILSIESILDRTLCALAVAPLGGLVAAGRLGDVLIWSAGIALAFTLVVYAVMRRVLDRRKVVGFP